MVGMNSASQRTLASVFMMLLMVSGLFAQDPETMTFRLNKVEANGLQKLSQEKFLELSGLKIGQDIKFADLKTVANRLYDSGLIAKVSYRYSWADGKLDVVFNVEESKPAPPPEPAAPAKPPTLSKIEFKGLQRLNQAAVVGFTGLKLGTVLDQQQLNVAAKQLAETGYFSEVTYNYRRENGEMVALFEVTEFKWDVECVFDNFVWFTKQELFAAIQRQVPGFDGYTTDHEALASRIGGALEQLMKQRGIQRTVNFLVSFGDLEQTDSRLKKEFIFTTIGPPMPVCKVAFPGATAAMEKQLQSGIKPLLAGNYSGKQFTDYVENMLLPVYSQRGFLLAKFSDVVAQPDDGANKKCPNGVNVSIAVEEGAAYKLGKFDWVGNQTLEQETMQDLFGMKPGSTANGDKISKGLNSIRTAYLNRGHLDLKLTVERDFEEGSRTANFRISVNEGQPYQMGEVVFKNASDAEQKRLRGKWKLAPGAVFNFSYVREFARKLSEERSGRLPRVSLQRDKTKQTANVVFTY